MEFLGVAVRRVVYIYASTVDSRSTILENLTSYYGSSQYVRASRMQSYRIKIAGDILEMLLDCKIKIHMSVVRETERYTFLLKSELD